MDDIEIGARKHWGQVVGRYFHTYSKENQFLRTYEFQSPGDAVSYAEKQLADGYMEKFDRFDSKGTWLQSRTRVRMGGPRDPERGRRKYSAADAKG